MTAEKISKIINQAESFKDEPPRPLRREIASGEPYPLHALGDFLGGAAKSIYEKIQAPQAICAQSVLAAATLAVQGHADIELPIGQTRPLSAFFMSIATTGERKSSCDTEALRPVNNKEETLRTAYQADLFQWQNRKEAWERGRSEILKKPKKDSTQTYVAAQLNALGPSPEPPLIPMLTCPEPTFEGICRYLMTGQPSIGVFSDEGGQFIGGHGMNEENRLKTAGAFCNLWDGKPVKRIRAGDGTVILPGRRVSVHLMAQPSVANVMLSNRMFEDQGLLSRFLFSAPDSTIGTRFSRTFSPESAQALQAYESRMEQIIDIPLPMKEGKTNELEPRKLSMDSETGRLWKCFADEVEKNMAAGGLWEQIRGFANKLPEHAGRLAGVLALVDDTQARTVRKDFLHAGIMLASYYAGEAQRLHEQGYVDPEIALAERLLDWLHRRWGEGLISLPDIYQRSLNTISDKKTAIRIVTILEEHGWLVRVQGGDFVNGLRRKDVWRIVIYS
ncbi:MAG: YfjI family protein [Alphaproteobacteria bacterium]|nr:DUF3987 domain-containing protein [Alphaproteobacteria bacterium]MBP7763200.1 DUF3987 domain-containing protein [Alphaproteobacteria bacterium]